MLKSPAAINFLSLLLPLKGKKNPAKATKGAPPVFVLFFHFFYIPLRKNAALLQLEISHPGSSKSIRSI